MRGVGDRWQRLGSRGGLFEGMTRDVGYALRALRRAPGFTLIASLTLALGIGAATAVFSVVHGVLLEPLAYPAPQALVTLLHNAPGANLTDTPMSPAQFFTYRDENRTFAALGIWSTGTATVTGGATPEEVRTVLVTAGALDALGVRPAVGQWFSREDDTPGAPETVLLTHGYWQRQYGNDVDVIGRRVIVDGRPRRVIGVMPRGFRFLDADADLFLPWSFDRGATFLRKPRYGGIARLKPGVTVAEANADVARMIPIWLQAWSTAPGIDRAIFDTARFAPALRPLKQEVVGDVGRVLWVLMGTVGIVLLIAGANVANLLLVRAEARQQELAVRAALGAGRARIARELIIESVALALIGGAVGVALAIAGLRFLVSSAPAGLPRLHEIAVDTPVVLFALVVSLTAGVIFGLVPALRHAGPRLATDLRGGGRTASASKGRQRTRRALVVAQLAWRWCCWWRPA